MPGDLTCTARSRAYSTQLPPPPAIASSQWYAPQEQRPPDSQAHNQHHCQRPAGTRWCHQHCWAGTVLYHHDGTELDRMVHHVRLGTAPCHRFVCRAGSVQQKPSLMPGTCARSSGSPCCAASSHLAVSIMCIPWMVATDGHRQPHGSDDAAHTPAHLSARGHCIGNVSCSRTGPCANGTSSAQPSSFLQVDTGAPAKYSHGGGSTSHCC